MKRLRLPEDKPRLWTWREVSIAIGLGVAICLAAGLAHAQDSLPTAGMPDVAPWIQVGFAAWAGWYLLTRAIPRMEDRAERRDQRFTDALEKLSDRADRGHEETRAVIREEGERTREAMRNGYDRSHSGNTDPGRVE